MRDDDVGEERSLEDKSGVLLLLVTTELEVLATLEGNVRSVLALGALETENDLLGGLGLLVEDGLGLTTVTLLLPVVTTLTLSVERSLTGLVLGDLVGAVWRVEHENNCGKVSCRFEVGREDEQQQRQLQTGQQHSIINVGCYVNLPIKADLSTA